MGSYSSLLVYSGYRIIHCSGNQLFIGTYVVYSTVCSEHSTNCGLHTCTRSKMGRGSVKGITDFLPTTGTTVHRSWWYKSVVCLGAGKEIFSAVKKIFLKKATTGHKGGLDEINSATSRATIWGISSSIYHRGPKQISVDIVEDILGQREKPQNSTPANARDPHQNSFINSNVVACRLAQLYPVRKLCCCRRIRTVNRGKFDDYLFNRGTFDN